MKTEIGGGEFEKKIKDQLFRNADNNIRNSFESLQGNEEIMDQFQRFLKDKCGPPDIPGKDSVIPNAIATPENTASTVANMVAQKFKKTVTEEQQKLRQSPEMKDAKLKQPPAQEQIVKNNVSGAGVRNSYISSKVLNAYKAVKEADVKTF